MTATEPPSAQALIDEAVVARVLREALATGGEFAEVFAEDRRGSVVALDDGRIEDISSGRERGAGVRVVVGNTTGFAHTADLSERGLLAAAEVAACRPQVVAGARANRAFLAHAVRYLAGQRGIR